MKKTLTWLIVAGAMSVTSAHATAIRLDGAEPNLQAIVSTLPGSGGINVTTDQYALDGGFEFVGLIGTATIYVEHAGNALMNSFGIYDAFNPTNRITIFNGAASAGSFSFFDPTGFASGEFGFYLDTPDGVWYSQTPRNADYADHMVAYERGGQYILAWEDLRAGSWDQDYNDFVVLVGGVKGVSVPEPATLGLLGLGMLGMGAFRRRKQAA